MQQRTCITTILLICHLNYAAAAGIPDGLYVGSTEIENGIRKYSIWADFAVEQYENGKKTNHRLQLWVLNCSSPPLLEPERGRTSCFLERTVLANWGEDLKTIITSHRHSEEEGTLKLTLVNWARGELDFSLTYPDNSRTEVIMRLHYHNGSIYLKSFQAISLGKSLGGDKIFTVEHRIPQYSYTLNAPIRVTGLKTEDDKRRDDFLNSLSPQDRKLWQDEAGDIAIFNPARMKRVFPDYEAINKGNKPFTAAHRAKLKQLMLDEAERWTTKSEMSEDGKRKTREFFKVMISEMK